MIGIGLAAGSGTRARPLTLKTPDYLRSKAAVRFLGTPVIEHQLRMLAQAGVEEMVVVARGRENRFQIKTLVGYGERFGLDVRYSPVLLDHLDRGSADATIRNAEYFDLDGLLFVYPVDSLIDVDLKAAGHVHRAKHAAFTMITTRVKARDAVHTYGVALTDESGRVTRFLEKPSPAHLAEILGPGWAEAEVEINAGFYLVEARLLAELGHVPDIASRRRTALDFGHDLLPWLIAEGYRVQAIPASWVGDLGNLRQYLSTMRTLLTGAESPPGVDLGPDLAPPRRVFGPPRTPVGPKWERVRIGRYVHIGPDTTLVDVSIGDECVIGRGVHLEHVHLDDGVVVGDGAHIRSTVVGLMARIRSTLDRPVELSGVSGIGDEAEVEAGSRLTAVLVYPRVTVAAGSEIHGPAVLTTRMAALRLAGHPPRRPLARAYVLHRRPALIPPQGRYHVSAARV